MKITGIGFEREQPNDEKSDEVLRCPICNQVWWRWGDNFQLCPHLVFEWNDSSGYISFSWFHEGDKEVSLDFLKQYFNKQNEELFKNNLEECSISLEELFTNIWPFPETEILEKVDIEGIDEVALMFDDGPCGMYVYSCYELRK